VLAETGDGVSTLRAIQTLKPDVVFLDINMPQLNGLEVAEAVRDTTTVVFLTAYAREIALAHGGSIEVSSNDTSGTTFTVRLPRNN